MRQVMHLQSILNDGYLSIYDKDENEQKCPEKTLGSNIISVDTRKKGGLIAIGFDNGCKLYDENLNCIASFGNHLVKSIFFNYNGNRILFLEENKKYLCDVTLDENEVKKYDDDNYKRILFKLKKYFCFSNKIIQIIVGLLSIEIFMIFGTIGLIFCLFQLQLILVFAYFYLYKKK